MSSPPSWATNASWTACLLVFGKEGSGMRVLGSVLRMDNVIPHPNLKPGLLLAFPSLLQFSFPNTSFSPPSLPNHPEVERKRRASSLPLHCEAKKKYYQSPLNQTLGTRLLKLMSTEYKLCSFASCSLKLLELPRAKWFVIAGNWRASGVYIIVRGGRAEFCCFTSSPFLWTKRVRSEDVCSYLLNLKWFGQLFSSYLSYIFIPIQSFP